MTDKMTDQRADLCLACGATIDHAHHDHRVGPFLVMSCHMKHCDACTFLQQFSKAHLISRPPYRKPAMRPTPAGKPAQAFLDLVRKEKERRENHDGHPVD